MSTSENFSIDQLCNLFGVPKELVEAPNPIREAIKESEARAWRFVEYSLKPWMERYRLKPEDI